MALILGQSPSGLLLPGQVGGASPALQVPSDLLAYWGFDADCLTSTKALDLSPNRWDGTLVGSPVMAMGQVGNGLALDGSTQWMTTGSLQWVNGQAFTFCAWVYSTETTGTYRNLLDASNSSAGPMIWWNTSGQVEFDGGTGGFTATPVYRNVWVHVTIKKPAGSTSALYFVNGQYVGTGAAYLTDGLGPPAFFQRGGGNSWLGTVDDIRVYNRDLDANEIGAIYSAGIEGRREVTLLLDQFYDLPVLQAAGGAVNVSLTGVAATAAAGTPNVTGFGNVTLTGVAATAAIGTLTTNAKANVTLTGVNATTAAGSVTITGVGNVTLTGVAGTAAVGTPTVTGLANVTLTGISASALVGALTTSAAANVTLTGVAATAQIGSLTVTGQANVTLTGVSATAVAGDISVSVGGAVNVNITGVAATTAVGTPTGTGLANVPVTGVAATAQVGTLTTSAAANTSITGVAATAAVSTPTVTGAANVTLVGVSASAAAGDITVAVPTAVSVTLVGVQATAFVGVLSTNLDIPVDIPQPLTGGGSGGGGGGRWERSVGQSGPTPKLSVKEQNAKERRELKEIAERQEREALEAEADARLAEKQKAALEEIRRLKLKAEATAKSVTAKSDVAFKAAEKLSTDRQAELSNEIARLEAVKLEAIDDEEEILILLLAAA